MLRTLVESACAEVEASIAPGALIQPESVEAGMDLVACYEWGREFLRRTNFNAE